MKIPPFGSCTLPDNLFLLRVRNAKKHLAFPKRVFLALAERTGVMKCKRTDVKKKKKNPNKALMF